MGQYVQLYRKRSAEILRKRKDVVIYEHPANLSGPLIGSYGTYGDSSQCYASSRAQTICVLRRLPVFILGGQAFVKSRRILTR